MPEHVAKGHWIPVQPMHPRTAASQSPFPRIRLWCREGMNPSEDGAGARVTTNLSTPSGCSRQSETNHTSSLSDFEFCSK
jgi:hypothetical protein